MFQSFYMVLFIFSLMFDSWWYESNLPIAPCPGLGAWRKFGCRWALMLWLGLPFDIPTSSMVSCLISDDLIMFPTQVPPETSTHASAAWASIFFSRAEISLLLVGFILQHSYTLTPPSTISCVPQWRMGTNFAAFSSSFLRYLQQMLLLSGSHFPLGVQVRVSEPGSINPGLMFVAGYPEPRHHRPLLRLKKVSKLSATQLPHRPRNSYETESAYHRTLLQAKAQRSTLRLADFGLLNNPKPRPHMYCWSVQFCALVLFAMPG